MRTTSLASLATAFVLMASIASGFAATSATQADPANPPSTAGWSNAELQGGQVTGARHTFDVQQAMQQSSRPAVLVA